MNIIKQKVRNLLFSIQTTGTAKHLVHIRINKQSAPVIGYANRCLFFPRVLSAFLGNAETKLAVLLFGES